jgi:hypothetical protein
VFRVTVTVNATASAEYSLNSNRLTCHWYIPVEIMILQTVKTIINNVGGILLTSVSEKQTEGANTELEYAT